ncbi:hypothetical protein CM19_06900 [Candidatus Acidianus copahuensis]|uniref:Uncharacterized protein n=1 Tax=Candidatus Acidianus copahuensis TaxID=1160895 RepID=A0A031LPV9_9CREN|nr:hypothetical protein CM19_06900 [Candidatus Acidianus copahuensis]
MYTIPCFIVVSLIFRNIIYVLPALPLIYILYIKNKIPRINNQKTLQQFPKRLYNKNPNNIKFDKKGIFMLSFNA